ncbi:DUF4136 domain-containing protein [Novosphingobium pentaromativorans]|nr:DUF4136 domain-containing protein [Novosphingobium pentaromativorans]
MHNHKRALLAAGMAAMALSPAFAPIPAFARPLGWGSGWGRSAWDDPLDRYPDRLSARAASRSRDSREGRVEVSRFAAQGDAAATLGHGPVTVESESGDGPWFDSGKRATYEAAIENALVGAGYDTLHSGATPGQVARLRITRQVLAPAEEKRSPVSGTAAMGVSNRGSAYGLGINIDLTKPRAALISTRLDTRIVDEASGKVLWEGYATIATREGDDDWSDDRIASKLATALFDNFPKADPVAAPEN